MRQIHFKQKLCFILHRHYATLEMLVEVKKKQDLYQVNFTGWYGKKVSKKKQVFSRYQAVGLESSKF